MWKHQKLSARARPHILAIKKTPEKSKDAFKKLLELKKKRA
ncbi:hypothetical protein HBZS_115840 [Helicobacter bizzozeronii CCUG 35545]|nr:hypothetical protein HBZS_115840 [Helicobacter bizzozeronii CCUG 35545]